VIAGDTIAAVATASGRGGVAVIRVSGPEALTVAARLTGRPAGPGKRGVRVEKIYSSADIRHTSPIDEAVVLFFKAPHSYTGEDVVEFQCHGGTVTPRRVMEACFAAGARMARRGEFTQRAFLNGKLDYDQAESVLDLVNARTDRAADAALEGLSGRKQRELKSLYETALDLSSRLEYALDVDEGDLQEDFFVSADGSLLALRAGIETALRRLTEDRLLRDGALVVLAGPPNVGKSSLMNALLEENRAIVSDVPGTTRDAIEEGLVLDGWPIRLVDTAGIRETGDGIEAEGVRRAEELLAKADVVLWLGDAGRGRADDISVHSKCDLGRGEGLNVSARTGEGLEELKRAIITRLESKVASVDSADGGLDTSPLLESLDLLSTRRIQTAGDIVLAANAVRTAAERIGTLVGATYSADLLDNLFSRFCIGK